MIYDTTYPDKETTRKIDAAVGKAFSFRERWRLGGIGSERMAIDKISEEYQKYLNAAHYDSNANLELRPNGLLLHFRHKLEVYTWVMPFMYLEIINEDALTLKSEGKFVQFKVKLEERFLKKVNQLRGRSE